MARKNSTKAVAAARTAATGDSRSAAKAQPAGDRQRHGRHGERHGDHGAVQEQRQVVEDDGPVEGHDEPRGARRR